MLENIKEYIRRALRPIAKKIIGVSPNTLTILGLLLGLVAAVLFAVQIVIAAGVFLLLSSFLDALDGAVARENNRITRYGGFLDSVSDRFADSAIIIGAMYGDLTEISALSGLIPGWFIGVLAIVGSLMVSYTRARGEAAGTTASVGIGDRAVRLIIIVIGAFLNMVNWAVFLVAVLSFITVFQRIDFVRKSLN